LEPTLTNGVPYIASFKIYLEIGVFGIALNILELQEIYPPEIEEIRLISSSL
jgi:hypothetical protein